LGVAGGSLASNGADCEDFSIAKYFALKELGVPIQRLRITYVKAVRLNQAHMVLAYYPEPDAVPLILDNLEDGESRHPSAATWFRVQLQRRGCADRAPGPARCQRRQLLQIRLWRALLDKLARELLY